VVCWWLNTKNSGTGAARSTTITGTCRTISCFRSIAYVECLLPLTIHLIVTFLTFSSDACCFSLSNDFPVVQLSSPQKCGVIDTCGGRGSAKRNRIITRRSNEYLPSACTLTLISFTYFPSLMGTSNLVYYCRRKYLNKVSTLPPS